MDCLLIPQIEVFHYQLLQLSFVFVNFEHIAIRYGTEKFQSSSLRQKVIFQPDKNQ